MKCACVEIPEIVTERLVLRRHRAEDLDACAAMWGDPDVVRFISGTPSTRMQCWTRMLTYAGLWEFLGFGYWAVVERDGGAFVGDVGLADFKREMTPSLGGVPEAGWVLRPTMHGRGYAIEAMSAVLRWADAHLAPPSVACIIDPRNAASLRLADKLGFDWIFDAENNGPVRVFSRARSLPRAHPSTSSG